MSRSVALAVLALLSLSGLEAIQHSGLHTSSSREWKVKFPELLCVWVSSI
ncbi:B2M isoform 10 [Pongo abelii]|uniref:B2M isoform 10 n=1 Tax=Pongo abelii TaxID=9601 RepID=A0A2J8S481_PONAB|nr:B2M isoform 10 [Pongo abelii]